MGAEILLTSFHTVEAKKSVSSSDAAKVFMAIEQQSGWSVPEIIKHQMRERHADGFTMSRDTPNCRLSVRRCIDEISVRFRNGGSEIRVLIPDSEISTPD